MDISVAKEKLKNYLKDHGVTASVGFGVNDSLVIMVQTQEDAEHWIMPSEFEGYEVAIKIVKKIKAL